MSSTIQTDSRKPARISAFIIQLEDPPGLTLKQKLYISHRVGSESGFADTEGMKDCVGTRQTLSLHDNSRPLEPGSSLTIEIRKQRFLQKPDVLDTMHIRFDDILNQLKPNDTQLHFEVPVTTRPKMKLWLDITPDNLRAAQLQIAVLKRDLQETKSILSRLRLESDVADFMVKLGTTFSQLNSTAKIVVSFVNVVYDQLKAQHDAQDQMRDLVHQVGILVDRIQPVQYIVHLEMLKTEMDTFFSLMDDITKLIERSLMDPKKIFLSKSNLVKVSDFKERLRNFKDNFDRGLNLVSREDERLKESLLQGKKLDPSDRTEECMENTRTAILENIKSAIHKLKGENVIWIKGHPGAGKSAIASSIMKDQGRHGLYFRFDRSNNETTAHALWRGIAYKLARQYPSVRKCIRKHIEDDSKFNPKTTNIDQLFTNLVKKPLENSGDIAGDHPLVFVIDAIDECDELQSDQRAALLRTLKQWPDLPRSFKLVITSRPESDIIDTISQIPHHSIEIPSGHDADEASEADIRTFLTASLTVIPEPKDGWHRNTAEELAQRAAGIFQWAKTALGILRGGSPEKRLDEIKDKGLERSSKRRGETSLYFLYSMVLDKCFDDPRDEEKQALRSVLSAMAFAKQPLGGTDDELAEFLDIDKGTLQYIRRGLSSVIDEPTTLRFNHQSFTDYLLSSECPRDLGIKDSEPDVVRKCVTIMSKHLRFNICGLETSYKKNTEFSDIDARIMNCISSPLSYACRFWADHLSDTSLQNLEGMVKEIVEDKLLFWLEVMSLLKEMNRVIPMLRRIQDRLDEVRNGDFSKFIHDALRFVAAFGQPISQSAPHIYLSALPFAPVQSLVAQHFRSRFPHTFELVKGRPTHWPSLIFSTHLPDGGFTGPGCVTFSPDQQSFAAAPYNEIKSSGCFIRIYDANAGALLSGPFHHNSEAACLDFSPDGLLLVAGYVNGTVIGWDIKSGQQYFTLPGSEPLNETFKECWVGYCDGGQRLLRVMQYEHRRDHWPPLEVAVWDVTNIHDTQKSVWSRTASMSGPIAFSLHASYLACGVARLDCPTIEIWDIGDGTLQLSLPTSKHIGALAISEDGRCLVCYFIDHTICVWSRSADGVQYEVVMEVVNHRRLHYSCHKGQKELLGVAYSSTRRLLVSLTAFGIVAWDVVTGEEVFNYEEYGCMKMSLSRDGKRLLVGQDVKMLELGYHSIGDNILRTLDYSDLDYGFDIRPPQPANQGRVIVKSSRVNEVENRHWIECHSGDGSCATHEFPDAYDIMLSPGGTLAIIWNHYDSPPSYAWSTITNQVLPVSFEDAKDIIWIKAVFSPAGQLMAAYSRDGTVLRVWKTITGHLVARIKVELRPSLVAFISPPAFSPDEHLIAYVFKNGHVMVRDIHTGALIAGPCRDGFGKMHFTADGKKLISHLSSSYRIWDVSSDIYSTPTASTGGFRDDSVPDDDKWILGHDGGILFWVPLDHRQGLHQPRSIAKKVKGSIETRLDFTNFKCGENWQEVQDH